MRHSVYGKHLGRDKDQRKRLFKGLISSLFSSGTIQTSESKAKAIKGLVDKVINFAKNKDLRNLQSYVADKGLRTRLTDEIAPKLVNRSSGYSSLVKLGTRIGDQTMVVRMSLIGVEQLKPLKKELEEPKLEKKAPTKAKKSEITAVKKIVSEDKKPTKRKAAK